MGAARNRSPSAREGKSASLRLLRWCVTALILATVLWFGWVYEQIQATATVDNAHSADAIAVFGAAEYDGRPSPVLHARLDKAVSLYDRGIAPVIVTLGGGSDKDSGNTEGGVGRDYLLANGVPYDRIIAETRRAGRLYLAARAPGAYRRSGCRRAPDPRDAQLHRAAVRSAYQLAASLDSRQSRLTIA